MRAVAGAWSGFEASGLSSVSGSQRPSRPIIPSTVSVEPTVIVPATAR